MFVFKIRDFAVKWLGLRLRFYLYSMFSLENSVAERGCRLKGCLGCPFEIWQIPEKACMVAHGHPALVNAVRLAYAVEWDQAYFLEDNVERGFESHPEGGWIYPEVIVSLMTDQFGALLRLLEDEWLVQGRYVLRPEMAPFLLDRVPDLLARSEDDAEVSYSLMGVLDPLNLLFDLFERATELGRGIEVGVFS